MECKILNCIEEGGDEGYCPGHSEEFDNLKEEYNEDGRFEREEHKKT